MKEMSHYSAVAPDTGMDQDIELTGMELEALKLEDGTKALEANNLVDAENNLSPLSRRKLRALTTGHKLKIYADFKSGKTPVEICLAHRINKDILAIVLNDFSFQELTNPSFVNQTKKLMSSRFYQLADLCLSHIDLAKLERLDAYKLGILASIALDKARLIEGQSTENISFKSLGMNIHATLDQLKERKLELMAMIQKQSVSI